jgi:hypothetical protein
MIHRAELALDGVGYDTAMFRTLIRANLPRGYRAMTLDDGAVLGVAAFASQDMLNYVLEEELLHLQQKMAGRAAVFGPGTAAALEEEINVLRRFRLPND